MKWELYRHNFTLECEKKFIPKEKIDEFLIYAKKLYDNKIPVIFDLTHFGKLVGYQNVLLNIIKYSPERFYRSFKIPKKNGSFREIEEPYPTLKEIQYWVLRNILDKVPVSPYAKAYQSNKGLIDNVKFHKAQKVLIKLDVKDFFGSITFASVYGIFHYLGYTKTLSNYFASICCLSGSLPQGAPTSPSLSNIFAKRLDSRIGKYVTGLGFRYTRYSDDITISGDISNKQINSIISFVKTILDENGLTLNTKKTKVLRQSNRQYVTGVVLNKKISAGTKEKKQIRQEIYYLKKFGYESHIRRKNITRDNYLFHLSGKINWVLYLEKTNREFLEYKQFMQELISDFYSF